MTVLLKLVNPIDSTNCLDFCFDNETPRHKVYLEAFGIANRSVTCREYLELQWKTCRISIALAARRR